MTLRDRYENIAIALAGLVQAIGLVKQMAQTGKATEEPFNASIYSLFQMNPTDPSQVFGNLQSIQWGLEKLIEQMSKNPDRSLTRYMLSIIHLQKKLSRSQRLINRLTERLNQIKKQVDFFSLTHPTVIANLADVYLQTISTFNFRIIIWGHQRILSAHETMEKIRALLLAGVRSATLWRQMGGSRWQFLLHRAKIKDAAEKLLTEIRKQP
jgi:high frequency lysogenization protein